MMNASSDADTSWTSSVFDVDTHCQQRHVVTMCCKRGLKPMAAAHWSLMVVGVCYCLTAIVGTFLNLLTLIALSRVRTLRKRPATFFILNLAAADLMYCLLALPVDAVTYLDGYDWLDARFARAMCSFSAFSKYTAAFMDWSSLALIAIERYFKIVVGQDSHKRLFSKRNTFFIIAGNWILHWVVLGVFAEYGYNPWTRRCDMMPSSSRAPFHVLDRGSTHVLWMAIVVLVITATCLKIWHQVRTTGTSVLNFSTATKQVTRIPHINSNIAGRHSPPCYSKSLPSVHHYPPAAASSSSGRDRVMDDHHSSNHSQGNDHRCVPRATSAAEVSARIFIDIRDSTLNNQSSNSVQGVPAVRLSSESMRRAFYRRELALVKILALTTGAYVALVAPMCVVNLLDYCVQHPDIRHVVYAIYVFVYFINFFIYVRRDPEYKRSCFELLRMIVPCARTGEV